MTTTKATNGGSTHALLAVGALAEIGLALVACDKPAPPPGPPAEATTRGARTDAKGRHHIVVELTTDDRDQWQAALNNVENVRKALGADKTDVELVAHGNGLSMLIAASGGDRARMEELSKGGVVFAACENTMKKQNVAKADLLPFATTVDSGVAEVVRKQEAAWAYLKSSK